MQKKEGILQKYKNIFSGWATRYFRLERSYLHYFNSKHEHSPIGTITRGEISEVKVSKAFPDRENVFEICQKTGYTWFCQASSVEDMVSWMQVLSPIPILFDPNKYPNMTYQTEEEPSPEEKSVEASYHMVPPASGPPLSPYHQLRNEAHHIAFHSNTTPEEFQHACAPPPYTPHDTSNLPPPQMPPPY